MVKTKFELAMSFDDDSEEVWQFDITLPNGSTEDDIQIFMDTLEYDEFFCDMEEFGVHDSYGSEDAWVGYGSYEITQENKMTVLKAWHTFFGYYYPVGDLVQITEDK